MPRNPKIKKANTPQDITLDQITELKRCMYGYTNPDTGIEMSGPVYFAIKYVRIQHPTRGDIPFNVYDYQEEMLNLFNTQNKVIILSARQTGKFQTHKSKIAIPDGWTTMGDVKIGDDVLTPDGGTAKVLDKFPQGVKESYRVTFDDGSSATSGLDHLWDTFIRNKWEKNKFVVQRKALTLREIMEYMEKISTRKSKSNYAVRIPVVKKVNFSEKQFPLDPYALGLLLGDGCWSQPREVCFTTIDQELVEYLTESIQDIGGVVTHRTTGSGMNYYLSTPELPRNDIVRIVRDLNLTGTKSATKFIPEMYMTGSHDQRLALLQGLMDSDGTVNVRNKSRTVSLTTISPHLRDGAQQLVWSLGGKCSYRERQPKNPQHSLAYDVFISLPCPKDCFRLTRKKDLCHEVWGGGSRNETDIRRTIVDITREEDEESSCILVDHPDHLYITDDYSVTHNSITSGIYILWYGIFNSDKTILIAAHKNAHAMEMIERIQYSYEFLPSWLKPGIEDDGWNKHSVKFDNKSRILSTATTGSSGRGLSISLLYLDEFAFVLPSIQEEFWTSILPTLSTGGACIMTSTPNGAVDKFASIWRASNLDSSVGGISFVPMHVAWDQPPGRDIRFKRDNIAMLGEIKWKQEYECLAGPTQLTLMDQEGNIITKTMHDLYNECIEAGTLLPHIERAPSGPVVDVS